MFFELIIRRDFFSFFFQPQLGHSDIDIHVQSDPREWEIPNDH